jgi:hypothetical protein
MAQQTFWASSIAADVMFDFSEWFNPILMKNRSDIQQIVSAGYIYDQAFKLLRPKALARRAEMTDKGVIFIICFFDENSSDDFMSPISHQQTSEVYDWLIKLCINDPTLGLVLKPKRPHTLSTRLGVETMNLINKVRETGRCLMLDNFCLPAEAAQIADLTIGDLIGGTAALESYLAGIPTVLIDTVDMRENVFYKWADGKSVFKSLEQLTHNLALYRIDKSQVPGFGDWSPFIYQLDPFRDGRAAERVGIYLRKLLESLERGQTRQQALSAAAVDYSNNWGAQHIVTIDATGTHPYDI